MKRSKRVYLAMGLAALLAFQQPGAAFAATEAASAAAEAVEVVSGAEAAEEGSVAEATSSDAVKSTSDGEKAEKASASDAEAALFDEEGVLMDGAVLGDGVLGAEGLLDELLAAEEATPVNAKKSLLDMEIQTADNVFQAGDVIEPEVQPKRRMLFSAGRMRAAATSDNLEEAIAALEEAVNNWDGTEAEYGEGLALGIIVDLSSFEIPVDQENKLISRMLNRNPQYFFLSNSYLSTKTDDGQYIQLVAPLIDMTYTIDDIQVFEDKVDEIVSMVDPSWSDEEKVLWLHDYIILTTAYDTDFGNFNAYNCLIDGDAVCQGYTLAYSYLLKQFDIEGDLISSATLQTGDDTEHVGHIWNLVKIDGENYYVDVTKDDPLKSYQYWCRHLNLMNGETRCHDNNHGTEDWVDSEGNPVYKVLPVSTDHDNWFWANCYAAIPYVYGGWVYTNHLAEPRYGQDNEIRIYRYDDGSDELLKINQEIWKNKATGGRLNARFLHFVESQDQLVFSGPESIYWLMEDGTQITVYEQTEDEKDMGNIFGMCGDFEDDGIIYYDMYTNRTSELQAEHILDLTDQLKVLAIMEQPADVTAVEGSKAQFTVTAEGPEPLTYRWESSADGENWTEVQTASGSDAMKLSVDAEMDLNGTEYRCVVSDGKGWFEDKTSETAKLTVTEKVIPVDTSSLEKALADAADAKSGIEIKDLDPAEVEKGVRYVRSEVSKALEDAIAAAQETLKTAKTTEEAEAAAKKLTEAVDLYRSKIETGTYEKKEPEPVDTSSLVKALAEAETAKTGIEIHDLEPSEVTKETKYVRTAVSKALDDAIAAAQNAMKSAKTTAEAEAAASKLMTAVKLYRSMIETGTWEKKEVPTYPSTGGGGGGGGPVVTKSSSSSGTWNLEGETWYYRNADGSVPDKGWNYLSYNGSGDWYFLNEKGSPLSGWIDAAGFRYYLNPVHDGTFGAMKTGWIQIDGIWYYLNPMTGPSALPGIPYGALLRDTTTPDGYRVNEKGEYQK